MSRYRGPRLKKIRRLRALPGLVTQSKYKKFLKNKKEDKKITYRKRNRNKEYRVRLQEKQKLRFNYGLTERQLVRYMHIAGKSKGSTGLVLLQLLEMRLDNIVFRLNMASTIPELKRNFRLRLSENNHYFLNEIRIKKKKKERLEELNVYRKKNQPQLSIKKIYIQKIYMMIQFIFFFSILLNFSRSYFFDPLSQL